MTAKPAEHHYPPTCVPDTGGRCARVNDDAIVLLLYGEEHVNLALADELELDGYEVCRASDTAKLRAVCGAFEVGLVIFGRATRRGAGLDVLRKVGHSRRARVLFLSGVRRAESRRRANRPAIDRLRGTAAVFVSPLTSWTDLDMLRYRRRHRIPESDAAALMHRSGECNCGAFASAAQERATLKALYPDFFAGIEALEAEAEAAGLRWCRWGGYDRDGNRATDVARQAPGLLCEACDSRQAEPARGFPSTPKRRRSSVRPILTLIPGGQDDRPGARRPSATGDEPDDSPA